MKKIGDKFQGSYQPLFAPLQSAPAVKNNVVLIKVGDASMPVLSGGKVSGAKARK